VKKQHTEEWQDRKADAATLTKTKQKIMYIYNNYEHYLPKWLLKIAESKGTAGNGRSRH
jgi:hypothetical protein